MPIGLFDSFDNLDLINPEDVASWIKPAPSLSYLENYIANKILSPQTLPLSTQDMKVDLSLLREALKLNVGTALEKATPLLGDNVFLNITLRKILIPERFLQYIPNLTLLTWAFVDALLLSRRRQDFFQDVWTVCLTADTDEIVGTILLPQFKSNGASLELSLESQTYKVSPGTLMVIPCLKEKCELSFKIKDGKILDKVDSALEISGGKLGLMIDGRI